MPCSFIGRIGVAPCNPPFAQASSGNCVNLVVDPMNCGKLDNVCAASFNSCSEGVCSPLPGIILANPISIWSASVNGATDDATFPVTLPFNITFYGTTTDSLTVTTNGVSDLCFAKFVISSINTSARFYAWARAPIRSPKRICRPAPFPISHFFPTGMISALLRTRLKASTMPHKARHRIERPPSNTTAVTMPIRVNCSNFKWCSSKINRMLFNTFTTRPTMPVRPALSAFKVT